MSISDNSRSAFLLLIKHFIQLNIYSNPIYPKNKRFHLPSRLLDILKGKEDRSFTYPLTTRTKDSQSQHSTCLTSDSLRASLIKPIPWKKENFYKFQAR